MTARSWTIMIFNWTISVIYFGRIVENIGMNPLLSENKNICKILKIKFLVYDVIGLHSESWLFRTFTVTVGIKNHNQPCVFCWILPWRSGGFRWACCRTLPKLHVCRPSENECIWMRRELVVAYRESDSDEKDLHGSVVGAEGRQFDTLLVDFFQEHVWKHDSRVRDRKLRAPCIFHLFKTCSFHKLLLLAFSVKNDFGFLFSSSPIS